MRSRTLLPAGLNGGGTAPGGCDTLERRRVPNDATSCTIDPSSKKYLVPTQ
jgi:hypothetical protein